MNAETKGVGRAEGLTADERASLHWLASTVSGHLWVDMPDEHVRPLMELRERRIGRQKMLRSVKSRSFAGVAITPAGRAALSRAQPLPESERKS